jgi:hypothetical protein
MMDHQRPLLMDQDENDKRNLDKAQNDQDNRGSAGSNPDKAGPAKTLGTRLPNLKTSRKIRKNPPSFINTIFCRRAPDVRTK